MPRFLFRFGYCTPRQLKANDANNWDDEESSAFWVEAASSEDALALGCNAAEQYVSRVFEQDGVRQESSWLSGDYAHWIDNDFSGFTEELLARLPVVIDGIYRDENPQV